MPKKAQFTITKVGNLKVFPTKNLKNDCSFRLYRIVDVKNNAWLSKGTIFIILATEVLLFMDGTLEWTTLSDLVNEECTYEEFQDSIVLQNPD